MKGLHWLCILLVTVVALVSYAGDIQVLCEPGLRVYLDGHFVGSSGVKDDGMFLANVRDGSHVIKVEKDGFAPQSFKVEVGKAPIQVKVEAFTPLAQTGQGAEASRGTVKQAAGSLVITTVPQICVIEVDGKSQVKEAPLVQIDGLAPGEHTITISKSGYDPISGVVRIQPGGEITVRGDLKEKKLETSYEGKGSLRLTSVPEHCFVSFHGQLRDKTHSVMNLSFIPAGEHKLVVTYKGRELSRNIFINDGYRTIVAVNFTPASEPFMITYERE